MDYKAMAEAALGKRAALVTEIRSVNDSDRTDAEKREFIEKANTDIEALTSEARSYVEQGEREAEVRDLAQRAGGLFAPATDTPEARGSVDLDEEFRAIARGESRGMTLDAQPFAPMSLRAAAGASTAVLTNSTWAGTTVQNKFVAEVLETLYEVSPILQSGAKIVNTASGEKMEWPFKNGRLAAAQVSEGVVYPRSTGSFVRFGLDAYKYGVIAEATQEMVQDSQIPLASIIAQDIGESLGVATAADFVKGNGTNKPFGLVPSTVLNTTLANAAAITADALVTFQHLITPRYRRNAAFYVSDDFVLKARLLKDAQNRYIWQDALKAEAPDTLLGKPVFIDVNMDPTVGAGKVPVVFGDFSKFIIRMVGSVNLSRSDEYGWDADVIAWKGNVRVDSGLSDAAATSKITMTA